VGIELGTSLDMIGNNLALIRVQEQARVNIFLNRKKLMIAMRVHW
jgi:hypothetical protein